MTKKNSSNLYNYDDYRIFLKNFLRDKTKNQRGSVGKLATSLGVNSAMVSQILHEKSHLSSEQALRLTRYYEFSTVETEYFMALVSMNRAGDKPTKDYYFEKVSKLASLGQTLKEQLDYQISNRPPDQGIYYSHWYYSAAWLLTSIAPQTKATFKQFLNLSDEALEPVLDFLTDAGMLEHNLGLYSFKGVHIQTDKDSEYLRQHHINWRLKAIQNLQAEGLNKNFHFTGPIVISKVDIKKINEKILDFLKEFREISNPSACEELVCLNIDWFTVV